MTTFGQGLVEAGLGVTGEVGGIVLDTTEIGAIIGVPANVVSAGAIAHGGSVAINSGKNIIKDSMNAPLEKSDPKGSKGGPTAGEKFSPSDRAEDAGKNCTYCGKKTTEKPGQPNSRETDHIIPRSQNGNATSRNRAPACRTCNRSKGARTPPQWRKAQKQKNTAQYKQ